MLRRKRFQTVQQLAAAKKLARDWYKQAMQSEDASNPTRDMLCRQIVLAKRLAAVMGIELEDPNASNH